MSEKFICGAEANAIPLSHDEDAVLALHLDGDDNGKIAFVLDMLLEDVEVLLASAKAKLS